MIIPENINLEYKSKMCRKCGSCDREKCEAEAFVKIENGKLISGTIDKEGMSGKLLREIVETNPPERVRDFLDQSTKLALHAIMLKGYSIGVSDYELSPDAIKKAALLLTNAEKKVDELIAEYRRGRLERTPGKTSEETLEDLIMTVLTEARNEAGRIAEHDLGKDNPAVLMGKAGIRGSMINVTQMTACLGQTSMRGKRILRGYRNKTIPYFKEGDISAKARGYIRDSYIEGLTPTEYYFHSMSGRDSLVDKG
ncbi:MAG: DNA-directed RNA polymerase subunit A', partial [archaeon]